MEILALGGLGALFVFVVVKIYRLIGDLLDERNGSE